MLVCSTVCKIVGQIIGLTFDNYRTSMTEQTTFLYFTYFVKEVLCIDYLVNTENHHFWTDRVQCK